MKKLKLILIAICILGFLYHTFSFLLFYWTYPVVVDIQTTAPVEFPIPAFTFCNNNGVKPDKFCDMGARCWLSMYLRSQKVCSLWPNICEKYGYLLPSDFRIVQYHGLLIAKDFSPAELQELKKPLDEFFKCKIVAPDGERNCTTEDILLGSYYSTSGHFSICYTINSRWSQPNRTVEKITRADKIEIEFHIDQNDRGLNVSLDRKVRPKFNYPASVDVQLVFHSNYVSMSPHSNGVDLLGGRRYQVNLQQEETHLLPAPYQTNCTDYMSGWRNRGGIGPLNPLMVVEECKYNLSLREFGCVPFSVDYPHNDTVCKLCSDCSNRIRIADQCDKLLEIYNQPCDSVHYKLKLEERSVLIRKPIVDAKRNISKFDCSKTASLTRRCEIINVEIDFSDFQIRTTSCKPKLERLELFSNIGGTMGIYLGISMLSVYGLFEFIVNFAHRLQRKRKEEKKGVHRNKNRKDYHPTIPRGVYKRTKVYNYNVY